MENFFKLKEHGTDVKTEVIAGLTTFMTMAYILAVNPSILGATGMDTGAIFTATALASAIGSFCMALFANLPFVLSAGMGLNAYFAYTVVLGMGYSWEVALTAVFVLGIICQLTGLYVPNAEAGFYSLIPSGVISAPASVAPTLFKMDFSAIASLNFVVVVFAFLFVDIFDTLGTLIGCATKANMLDKEGKLPGIKGALMADAVGTTVGACLGTSTITTFVESSSGIAEGGRTGLTSVVSGLLFILALFFSPVFLAIPSFATAPALIVVGFFMMQSVAKINWSDMLEAIPAFICIFAMPFMYSISEGISFGVISFVVLNAVAGKAKKITPLMWVLAVLFILKYIFL